MAYLQNPDNRFDNPVISQTLPPKNHTPQGTGTHQRQYLLPEPHASQADETGVPCHTPPAVQIPATLSPTTSAATRSARKSGSPLRQARPKNIETPWVGINSSTLSGRILQVTDACKCKHYTITEQGHKGNTPKHLETDPPTQRECRLRKQSIKYYFYSEI